MFENMTINQMMGLVFIFLSPVFFIVAILSKKSKSILMGSGLYAWERQRKGKSLTITREEGPEYFKYMTYAYFAFSAILLIFGILVTLGILNFW